MSKGPVVGTVFRYFNVLFIILICTGSFIEFNPSGDLFYADNAVC